MTAVLPNPNLLPIRRDSEAAGDRLSMIRLDRNERIGRFPEAAFQAIIGSLRPEDLTTYPDPGPFLQRLQRATGLPAECLCPTAGSDGAIRRAFHSFVRPGDGVVVPDPTYAMYTIYSRMLMADLRAVPYEHTLELDIARFCAHIVPGTRLVAVANPGQPTGGALTTAELLKIIEAARAAGALCIIDEAYHPFYPESMIRFVPDYDNLMIVRSFSKAAGLPGIRLGFAAAQPHLLQGLHAVRGNAEVNALAYAAGCYALDHPELIDEFGALVERGRQVLCDGARAMGFRIPRCFPNFQILLAPDDVTPSVITEGLRRRRYLIRGSYDVPGLRNSIRVSLDGPDIMEPFVRCLGETMAELRGAGSDPQR